MIIVTPCFSGISDHSFCLFVGYYFLATTASFVFKV